MTSFRRPFVFAVLLAGLMAASPDPALANTKPAPAARPAPPPPPPPRPQVPPRMAPPMQPARPLMQPVRPVVQRPAPAPNPRLAGPPRSAPTQARRPPAPIAAATRAGAPLRPPAADQARGASHPSLAQRAPPSRTRPITISRPDARIVTAAPALHTRGLEHGLALARAEPPRPFLRPALHRDEASERTFIASHAAAFHTLQVRDFNAGELARWRAGQWRNEWHYGRRGWWYEADGAWYSYSEPVYPYPEDVALPVVYEAPVLDGADLSAQEGVPSGPGEAAGAPPDAAEPVPAGAPDIPPLPPAPVGWYRCSAPSGYYPGVASCGASWDLVENAPLPGEQ